MHDIAPEVISIADSCLGGLQGRSALLIGPEEQRYPYLQLLKRERMKFVFQEESVTNVALLIPQVQLLISMPVCKPYHEAHLTSSIITAAEIAKGCEGRRTPLLIFDLASSPSVEDLAGLLPAVCLYTPDDLRHILFKAEEMKAS